MDQSFLVNFWKFAKNPNITADPSYWKLKLRSLRGTYPPNFKVLASKAAALFQVKVWTLTPFISETGLWKYLNFGNVLGELVSKLPWKFQVIQFHITRVMGLRNIRRNPYSETLSVVASDVPEVWTLTSIFSTPRRPIFPNFGYVVASRVPEVPWKFKRNRLSSFRDFGSGPKFFGQFLKIRQKSKYYSRPFILET